jgi:ribonuclease BN (tRNA processing enzyme)
LTVELTVLGTSGGYAGPGKACSGYLLRGAAGTLMLDIGPGSLANMLKYIGADDLGALSITHMHYDHYVDIYGLLTARRFWESPLPPLRVYAPSGAEEFLSRVISERSRKEFSACLEITEHEPWSEREVEGFKLITAPSRHVVESYSFRIEAEGKSVCYSGDTDICDELIELAEGVDLLICESTFTSEVSEKEKGHLSGIEAGEVAVRARAGSLMITHVWPTLSGERAVEDAGSGYRGPVMLAREGMVIEL